MAKFKFKELIGDESISTRLGTGSVSTTPANAYTDKEVGKFVKLSGTDAHVLCAVGNPIEGVITAVESYTADDFSMGSVDQRGRKRVLLDGSEAAGTGSIAIGDYVVCGTPVAKDTALTSTTPPKVRKGDPATRCCSGRSDCRRPAGSQCHFRMASHLVRLGWCRWRFRHH
jgi:hypothetical protein